ncbi:hypothetical protein ACWJKU_10385 [Methylocaldum sp. MU1018]
MPDRFQDSRKTELGFYPEHRSVLLGKEMKISDVKNAGDCGFFARLTVRAFDRADGAIHPDFAPSNGVSAAVGSGKRADEDECPPPSCGRNAPRVSSSADKAEMLSGDQ